MRSRHSFVRVTCLLSSFVLLALGLHCGGGQPVTLRPDAGTATLTGVVVKGLVAGATVTAYAVSSSGERGTALASATTDASGAFTLLDVPSYNGPLLIVATGGSYPEEAVASATVRLESQELTYLLGSYTAGSSLQGLAVTPVSHLAAGLASHWIQAEGKPVSDAADEAWLHLNNHFGGLLGGGLDWRTVAPANLTASGTGQLDASGKAGLLLATLSMEARGMAERAGLTPGAALSSLALVEALYQDVRADGFFDGKGEQGQLLLPAGGFTADAGPSASALDGQTLRFALGQAVERFVRSDRNQSGLTPNDVLPLIQQLTSNSDARIFRSSGVDYDHQPPAVLFSATFTRAVATQHEPVGPLKLVGGTVTVTADITDASTIQSATLAVNGKPLTATATGGGAHLMLTGSFDTVSDGSLTVTAAVTDVHGNAALPSYALTVDNTAPAINVAAGNPTPNAFYSGAVPVDVSASDASGITAFTSSGLSGFTNLSGVVERITGSWNVPAAQMDGQITLQLTAIDSAFNVTTLPVTVNIDRTAPSLALAAPLPARYTNSTTVMLHLTASDLGSGVGAVKASVNGAPEVTVTTPANGSWDVPLDLGPEGNKRILVWALDRASPAPNTSYNSAIVVDVTRDATNPAPIVQGNVGSYYDERPASTSSGAPNPGMGLKLNASGNPITPAVYTFPATASKRAVMGASDVYKAATRLSWGRTPPTVQQLYAQDGVSLNVPFIAFDVPVTKSNAPISPLAQYTITCNQCISFQTAVGQLIRDTNFTSDPQRFLLPLTAETVPGLAGLSQAKPLQVHVAFTDEAGNQGGSDIEFTFHVVSPPLVIQQDTLYTSRDDPTSIFGYHTNSTRNYDKLFNPLNPSFTAAGVRAIRYVVQNPTSSPVALRTDLGPTTFFHAEAWNDIIRNAFGGTLPDAEGTYTHSLCTSPAFTPPAPCGGFASATTPALYRGNFPSTCTMPSSQVPAEGGWSNSAAVVAAGSLASVSVYLANNEAALANPVSGAPAFVIVPPAAGNIPGSVVVYLNRPLQLSRSVPIQLADVLDSSYASLGTDAYSFTVEDFWYKSGYPYNCCEEPYDPDNPVCYSNGNQNFALRRHAKYLVSASTSVSGSASFTSQPLDVGGAQLLGEASTLYAAQPFTASFNH